MKQEFFIGCKTATALALGLLLAGCTANSGTVGSTPFTEAAAQNDALNQRVDDLFVAEGATLVGDLPSDKVSYNGLVHGDIPGGSVPSAPELEYFADLSLDVNFNSNVVGGTVDNFRTDLTGFTAPTGSATVIGSVTPADPSLDFSASGTLTGTDREASYAIFADGVFIGDSAQAATGGHDSDFLWVDGPDTGTTSYSDGNWAAEQ